MPNADLSQAVHPEIVETAPLALHWPGEDATAAFARQLAALLAAQLAARPGLGVYIQLHGQLGAGKTTFTRHLLRALGVQGRIKSPTYALVEQHTAPGGLAVSHFDFYRFSDPHEWEDAGLRELFAAPGLKLAEWPEKAAALLPAADLALHIEPLDTTAPAAPQDDTPASAPRAARLSAGTPLGRQLMRQLALPPTTPPTEVSA